MQILFIGPTAHNYKKDIIDSLERNGHQVDYIPDFVPTFFNRALRYSQKKAIRVRQNCYIKNQVKKRDGRIYDIVFIIRGYGYNKDSIKYMKDRFPCAKFILYQWDPLRVSRFDPNAFSFFDKIFTFDYEDAKIHNIEQKSLFYSSDYNSSETENDIDISFIGATHSNRVRFLLSLKDSLPDDITLYVKLNCHFVKYYTKFLLYPHYRLVSRDWISFRPIQRDVVQHIFNRSKAVLDIHHPLQNGLSIRVIETVSKGKKLITTNANIVNESFYTPEKIVIVDPENIVISKEFLFSDKDNMYQNMENYQIDNWLKYILK